MDGRVSIVKFRKDKVGCGHKKRTQYGRNPQLASLTTCSAEATPMGQPASAKVVDLFTNLRFALRLGSTTLACSPTRPHPVTRGTTFLTLPSKIIKV